MLKQPAERSWWTTEVFLSANLKREGIDAATPFEELNYEASEISHLGYPAAPIQMSSGYATEATETPPEPAVKVKEDDRLTIHKPFGAKGRAEARKGRWEVFLGKKAYFNIRGKSGMYRLYEVLDLKPSRT
jgi:hypothetical protein